MVDRESDTDEEAVDVCVVEGEVTSQLKDPSSSAVIISLVALIAALQSASVPAIAMYSFNKQVTSKVAPGNSVNSFRSVLRDAADLSQFSAAG